jgi:hypothetical protein
MKKHIFVAGNRSRDPQCELRAKCDTISTFAFTNSSQFHRFLFILASHKDN